MNLFRAVFGGIREINTHDYRNQITQSSHLLLDVRNVQEFSGGHIEGSQNIPLNKLAKKLENLPKDQLIVCVCRTGERSREATYLLQKAGFNSANLVGGIVAWRREGGKLTNS
jgi:rhodanese-related sulfurtransferase